MKLNGLMTPENNVGLIPVDYNESQNQPAQNMEQALKKKREKMAMDKLGIMPEETDAS